MENRNRLGSGHALVSQSQILPVKDNPNGARPGAGGVGGGAGRGGGLQHQDRPDSETDRPSDRKQHSDTAGQRQQRLLRRSKRGETLLPSQQLGNPK